MGEPPIRADRLLLRASRVGAAAASALALLGVATWTPAGAAPDARPRRTLAVRRADVDAAERRLAEAVERAREDPRIARVDAYLALARPEDFVPTRRTRVADLAEFLADDDAPDRLRERVRDALTSIPHRSLDPDLASGEGRNRRAAFCRDRLVPLLARPGDKALRTRQLVAEVLESFWHFTDASIQRYDPRDDTTWKRAVEAYKRGINR